MPNVAAHTFLKCFIEPWELVAVTPLHASTAAEAEAGWSVSVCLLVCVWLYVCLSGYGLHLERWEFLVPRLDQSDWTANAYM